MSFTAPSPASAPSGCLDYALFAVAAAWVLGVTIAIQLSAWTFDQVQLLQGVPLSGWFWVVVALVQGLLLLLPVALLAWLVRAPRFRAAYQTWALAIGFGALLSLARLSPITWTQPAALVQIVLSLLATGALLRLRMARPPPSDVEHDPPHPRLPLRARVLGSRFSAFALATGIAIILPWLWYGALGSPLDTFLDLLAAGGLGLFAGVLLDRRLIAPILAHGSDAREDIGFGGAAAGVALLVLGAGFGYGGSQLPLMFCLLPLGGAALALGRRARMRQAGRGWPTVAALVGLVAAGPLLLLDPDELLLGLDVIGWVTRATWLTLLSAFVAGLLLWARDILPPNVTRWPERWRWAAPAGLAAALLVGALVYFAGGQPGFYGERIFVILRDQADLGQAAALADRPARLSAVYTTLTQHANQSQADLRATLDRLGVVYRPYYLVDAIEVDAGPFLRAYLATRPEVDRILDSPRLRPLRVGSRLSLADLAPPDADAPPAPPGPEWNILAIGADRVWDELGVTGAGIVVGESDSGVQGDHPALRERYRGRGGQDDYSWLDPWNGSPTPVDADGHGTHTTGTILGAGGIGVAPGAEWIGCVNLGRNLGNPPFYLDCMQFMLAPYPRAGDPFADGDTTRAAHVLNNSWGCPAIEGCDPASLGPAVRALRAAGIFVVASAGNSGPRCGSVDDPLAIYPEAFSVGAINRTGDIADFSSRGPVTVDGSGRLKPDIVAPGVNIRSSLPGGAYGLESGTSMAGPHVAGVVALIWSAQPKLIGDIARTEQILRDTAGPYEGERGDCGGDLPNATAGYGVVDAYAAVKAARELR
jgi:hypothetical protein